MKASIILPMYGHWNMTFGRLGEFRTYLPSNCEIILVNDCSPEDEMLRIRNGVAFWQKSGVAIQPLKYVENKANLGFAGSMNQGAKHATGDILVFHSNDVKVSGDYITPLLDIFSSQDEPVLVGHRLINWQAGWNQFGSKTVPYLEGYFIACRKSDFDNLGGWDTRYGRYDYEDVDLSMAASVMGYNLIEFSTKFLNHIGGATIGFSQSRMEHTELNRGVFQDKWRDILLE